MKPSSCHSTDNSECHKCNCWFFWRVCCQASHWNSSMFFQSSGPRLSISLPGWNSNFSRQSQSLSPMWYCRQKAARETVGIGTCEAGIAVGVVLAIGITGAEMALVLDICYWRIVIWVIINTSMSDGIPGAAGAGAALIVTCSGSGGAGINVSVIGTWICALALKW